MKKEGFKVFEGGPQKTSEQILKEMEAQGLRPATLKEVFEMGGGPDIGPLLNGINEAIQANENYKKIVEENLESFKQIRKVVEGNREDPDQATELKNIDLLINGFEYSKGRLQNVINYDRAMLKMLVGEDGGKEK